MPRMFPPAIPARIAARCAITKRIHEGTSLVYLPHSCFRAARARLLAGFGRAGGVLAEAKARAHGVPIRSAGGLGRRWVVALPFSPPAFLRSVRPRRAADLGTGGGPCADRPLPMDSHPRGTPA